MPHYKRKGIMLILSSPSGAGKTTIAKALTDSDPNIKLSISVTTRPKRNGEVEGKDYYFITKKEYDEMKRSNMLLEDAFIFGNYYGTPRKQTEEAVNSGIDLLYDIDWQGALQLINNCREDVVSIFILPPSFEVLEGRLRSRATDSEEAINRRLSEAKTEISKRHHYDYVITNHEVSKTLEEVRNILQTARKKREQGLKFMH